MACHLNDNVYTHTFTPREYQVELLDTAKKKNTIVCSSTSTAKAFIAIKLLQEFSWEMRTKAGKRSLFLLDSQNLQVMTSHVSLLTDLNVENLEKAACDEEEWERSLKNSCVIVTTAPVCSELIELGFLDLTRFNLLVIDDCLYGDRQKYLEQLMLNYRRIKGDKPRILGLAAGFLGPELQPIRLEAELQRLEKLLCSSVDTSSELVTLLRLCCRPRERILECEEMVSTPLQEALKHKVELVKQFLADHRYDPSEIYEDEFVEELKYIPDPKQQPLQLLEDFLYVLEDMGSWCADQAALSILAHIEKLKVKVPYERHYLLLCMVATLMVSIRATCDSEFQEYSEKERIRKYAAPKVLRFLDVIREFQPSGERPPEPVEATCDNLTTKNCRGKGPRGPRRAYVQRTQSEDNLCALIFVHNRCTAKVLYSLLYNVSQHDEDFWWVSALYSVEKIADPTKELREAENEHRRQEDVLRKYRTHECNIMVATSVLEQGCDLPKCNLVIRFDLPKSFHSYIQSKARARSTDSHYILLARENQVQTFVKQLAEFIEVENTLLRRCYSLEPVKSEEKEADCFTALCPNYQPIPEPGAPYVNLQCAIALVNRYCAKLPSDTFTRLTPIWNATTVSDKYVCSIRLPINSPVKQTVTSPPVINPLLARRAAAFLTCQLLHKAGELDDYLQPVGKENFKASEEDWNNFPLEVADEELTKENAEPRPGTTKRRQYYYKRVADSLVHCHPSMSDVSYFYRIVMTLTCPLPEEQNTRGRRIYPPEESPQGFGILTCKKIPKICPFPIFTRSGEVSVSLELCSATVILNDDQIHKISEFLNYTFTSVLRLQKYLMLFDPVASENAYLIVPTFNRGDNIEIDWTFIDLIYENRNVRPQTVPEEERSSYTFDPMQYKDAVVMPWYRNQDQPQYFYVAEICTNLNPKSAFPGSEYATFEEYYLRKYGITIKNLEQHLLDVDHTSARLNFLTPRYVNRKGVALPTSSEETKRAKRENLEQKQILVPELCAIHPFPASLWRKAVCLPCILYRVNALLLADQIRKTVAIELGLGMIDLDEDFSWPALNFGWNLSDVLKKNKEPETPKVEEVKQPESNDPPPPAPVPDDPASAEEEIEVINCTREEDPESKDWIEIGTWSNDMALADGTVVKSSVRYASPTSWMTLQSTYEDFSDSDESFLSSESDSECGGLKIEFTGDNVAEAVDSDTDREDNFELYASVDVWSTTDSSVRTEELKEEFLRNCLKNEETIMNSGVLIRKTEMFRKVTEEESVANVATKCERDDLNIRNLSIELEHKVQNARITAAAPEGQENGFSFDMQPNLSEHPGPSPSVILQALTMSNANDGINLERLETIGDSFLKYAITNYLYSKYDNIHEGKLSHLRSKQVSNLNLYRLGKRKALGECMIATKFDPHDNWLPPCYYVPKELEEALMDARVPANYWTAADMAATREMTLQEVCEMVRQRGENLGIPSIIPYNLVTQHSIPDKSIADCVEALIGAYLIECGPRGALLFMAWLGIRVLPQLPDGNYGELEVPQTPLLRHVADPEGELTLLLDGYDKFEDGIGYRFNDRAYLLQALTHASYSPNTLTDCYQRLEFLGDAVLDYLITRHLYEDARMHSPGALTDLRSALVNNTIFASLAVRHGFHRYFRHLSPGLHEVVERFIRLQEESGHTLVEELYLLAEHECEEVEDVEVPKALGDVFESVAGAIFLDAGMSLDAVWKVYYRMMQHEIEQFSDRVPKSPIRELLELEPETAKFGKPEKLADGRRVRVTVEVFGKGVFKGIGRNYRIAKCTAAKCALKYLKRRGMLKRN